MGAAAVKTTLYLGVAGLVLALSGCQRDVILQGERFPVRAPFEIRFPVEGQADPVAPPDRPENRSAPMSIPGAVANANGATRAALPSIPGRMVSFPAHRN